MTRNFSELMTDTKPQEARRTSSRVNAPQNKQTKKLHSVYIMFKLQEIKDKEKILERSSGGHFIYREAKTRIIPTCPQKTCKKEEDRAVYFKVLRECYSPI